MPRLIAIAYSPWSEKARWALDHHQINYREIEYLPMLGAPIMRLMMRKLWGKITVPVLFVDGDALQDSYDIARYADRVGSGTPLFPSGSESRVADWNTLSEEASHAARALATRKTAADPEALERSVPRLVPGPLRTPLAKLGVRYLENKYRLDRMDADACREAIRLTLGKARDALGGGDYILDGFSYADIAVAVSMQLFCPVDDDYIRIGRHARRGMTDDVLAEEFADLAAWRDRLYANHRR